MLCFLTQMDLLRHPFKGVVTDIKGRATWYKHDWVAGLHSGFRSVSSKGRIVLDISNYLCLACSLLLLTA
jgi:hypothetical protein